MFDVKKIYRRKEGNMVKYIRRMPVLWDIYALKEETDEKLA
jgi:hypothetical protein